MLKSVSRDLECLRGGWCNVTVVFGIKRLQEMHLLWGLCWSKGSVRLPKKYPKDCICLMSFRGKEQLCLSFLIIADNRDDHPLEQRSPWKDPDRSTSVQTEFCKMPLHLMWEESSLCLGHLLSLFNHISGHSLGYFFFLPEVLVQEGLEVSHNDTLNIND